MFVTIVESPEYRKKSKVILGEEESQALINYLAQNPQAGDLIQGTGGVRKIRWGRPGQGKRGGVRAIYYYYNDAFPIFMLTLFAKNERENLSKAECNELAKLTKILLETYTQGKIL